MTITTDTSVVMVEIEVAGLAMAFLPTAVVLLIMYRWAAGVGTGIYATMRMLVQLLLVGFVLVFIFETDRPEVISALIVIMLLIASTIAIRPMTVKSTETYSRALLAISASSLLTLTLVSQFVIGIEPWFSPRYLIPLGGMIISGSMNAVSLGGERLQVELARDEPYQTARRTAFKASVIPIINSLFAVGLVALPGMMTGQILSGVSPLIAVKYQIVVMNMLFGAAGMASAIFLSLSRPKAAD